MTLPKDFFTVYKLKEARRKETEYYPLINKWLISKGFDFQRIEQHTVPDYLLFNNISVFFMEVKYYRGREQLKDLTNYHIYHELNWQDGQLGFRDRVLEKNENYYLMIVNRSGEFILV